MEQEGKHTLGVSLIQKTKSRGDLMEMLRIVILSLGAGSFLGMYISNPTEFIEAIRDFKDYFKF